jgi:protein PhnA
MKRGNNANKDSGMAKGYQGNKDRLDEIGSLGKAIGKRAGFKCEWCESRDEPRVWDYKPEAAPDMETLALLCQKCRNWAAGKKASSDELRSIRKALWSTVPAVAEGAAWILAQCGEPWAREAFEESFIDDAVKTAILKQHSR